MMNRALRQLLDQVGTGVVWVRRNGLVRYANKAAAKWGPVMPGQALADPVADHAIKAAGQGMLKLPFKFELKPADGRLDAVKAVIVPAPIGADLMMLLDPVTQVGRQADVMQALLGHVETELVPAIDKLVRKLPQMAHHGQQEDEVNEWHCLAKDAAMLSQNIDKLRDLVCVLSDGIVARDERILLQDLLSQAVRDVRPLAGARDVTLVLKPPRHEMPAIYGNQHWLRKAANEFLAQAIQDAQTGARVELSVQYIGTHALVRAHHPGQSGRPAPRRSFGLGLPLAERILAMHGGSVRIEDEFGSLDVILEIPAGAPANEDAQLSVEQAQRYALDVAQLLARSIARQVEHGGPEVESAPLNSAGG